ncbi:MAG: hypothetical protein IJH12_11000 [Clostridia bacterium]|nr:hypothetical protein [Clostridia bacterium]
MKKSVKVLIVILCLIIVGLLTFIVVDKVINKKIENVQNNESNIVNTVNDSSNSNESGKLEEMNIKKSDFIGTWSNDEDTTLIINEDGTFQADHFTASSEIYGDYTINGENIEFICKKNDDTYNRKWSGRISKEPNGNFKLNVNLYDWDRTLEKVQERDSTNITNTTKQNDDETKIANDAIKKALKDDTWIKNNVFTKPMSESFSVYKSMYGNDWYSYAKESMVLAKISTGNVPMYIVGVVNPAASEDYYLVTYKDGNVIVNKIPHSDYAFSTFDLYNNVVQSEADYGTEYYGFDNNDGYMLIAETHYDEVQVDDGNGNNTNTSLNVTYKINNEIVSADTFKKFEEKYNFKKIETKLTDENIDKYVK